MDWKSVADKIDEVEQFELGVKEGVYEGAKSMVEGFVALPKLFDKAKLDASEVLVRTATEQDYRERIFERVAQLARDTEDFGINMYRDPVAMTTAGYNAVMGKVAQGKEAYAKAVTAAEQEGRLPQFYGKIGGRGGFEAMAAVFPISKVGLAGKAGTLIKAGEELANASKVVEEAGAAAKVLTQVEAAAEAGAQYAKEEFGIIAKCQKAEGVIKSEFTAEIHSAIKKKLNVGELAEYKILDPNAKVGLTGSAATGKVGNPNKPTFGQPIDPNKFDLDLFVQSDILLETFGSKLKAAPVLRQSLVDTFPDLFGGLKPGKNGLSIKFRPTGSPPNGSVLFD